MKEGGEYRYFTLEKTEDLFGEGNKSVFGEWSNDGARHRYIRACKYDDEESFLKELAGQVNGNL